MQKDFYIVTALVIAAAVITAAFRINFFASTLLFFAAPGGYLFLRKPRPIKRILAACLLFGTLLTFEFNFLAELNGIWIIPYSVFPYKILGVFTIDALIWGWLWVFFIIVFYEYFFEHEIAGRISPNFIYGLLPALSSLAVMLALFFVNPQLLKFSHGYLILGASAFIPFFFTSVRKVALSPRLVARFLKVGAFFFFVHLAHELIALYAGQWYFPAQAVGMINFVGMRFPFEELVFWIMLSGAMLAAEYEYFVDDGR